MFIYRLLKGNNTSPLRLDETISSDASLRTFNTIQPVASMCSSEESGFISAQPLHYQLCDELETAIQAYCATFGDMTKIPRHRQRDIETLQRFIDKVRGGELTAIRFREQLDTIKTTIITGWLGRSTLWKGNKRIKGLLTIIGSETYRYSAFEADYIRQVTEMKFDVARYQEMLKLDKKGEALLDEIYAQLMTARATIETQEAAFEQLSQKFKTYKAQVTVHQREWAIPGKECDPHVPFESPSMRAERHKTSSTTPKPVVSINPCGSAYDVSPSSSFLTDQTFFAQQEKLFRNIHATSRSYSESHFAPAVGSESEENIRENARETARKKSEMS